MGKSLFMREAEKSAPELEAEDRQENFENAKFDTSSVKQKARKDVVEAKKKLKAAVRSFTCGGGAAATVIEAEDDLQYKEKALAVIKDFEVRYFGTSSEEE